MGANEKLWARRRAWEAQVNRIEAQARRNRVNAAGAEEIRAILHRVSAVDSWERKRFDHAAESIRADALRRRSGHFRGLQTVIEQMRARGQTLAQIAELAGVDVREIRAALRRAQTGDASRQVSPVSPAVSANPDASSVNVDSPTELTKESRREGSAGGYDPTRCVRCDAAMLDADAAPRRGRRRLYCSDTCRRDASAARTAAQRYGAPIRVVEVPKATAPKKQLEGTSEPHRAEEPIDVVSVVLEDGDALRRVLAPAAEQARLKKLDRATLTAARNLSNAVHPHRDW